MGALTTFCFVFEGVILIGPSSKNLNIGHASIEAPVWTQVAK
jgi:hypothetical protein